MGIPQFIGTLRRKSYSNVFIYRVPDKISSLSIDFNSLIHQAAATLYGYAKGTNPGYVRAVMKADINSLENQLFINIITLISEIISYCHPSDLLVLAVDGVVPLAKMQQQRERRYKAGVYPSSPIFDSNCITPGTPFMQRLDNFIQRWIYSNRLNLPPRVIFSGHLSPGEGEHKIFQLMRENKGDIYDMEGNHIVHGMDADLVVLSLMSQYSIYLSRSKEDIIDITALSRGLIEEMRTETAIEDFCFIVSLLGNDFVPRPVAATDLTGGVEALLQTYSSMMIPLTGPEGIIYENFVKFLEQLAKREPGMLQEVSQKYHRYPSRMFTISIKEIPIVQGIKKEFNHATFRDAWYINALRNQNKEISDYLTTIIGNRDNTRGTINDMCHSYLEGIEWIYAYYNGGMKAINDKWVYRFFHAPMFQDLALYAKGYDFITGSVHIRQSAGGDFNCLHQILMVIPPNSYKITPPEIHELYANGSSLSDDMPDGFPLEMDNCDEFHEFRALLPSPNWKKVIQSLDFVVSRSFNKVRFLDFQEAADLILINDDFKEEYTRRIQSKKIHDERQSYRGGFQRGRGRGQGTVQRGRGGYVDRGGRGRGNYRGRY